MDPTSVFKPTKCCKVISKCANTYWACTLSTTQETHLRRPQVRKIFEVDQRVWRHCIPPQEQCVSHNVWRHCGTAQSALLPVLLHAQTQTVLRPQALNRTRKVRKDLVLLLLQGMTYSLLHTIIQASMHLSKCNHYLQLLCTVNVSALT